jgi:hypothetical protein
MPVTQAGDKRPSGMALKLLSGKPRLLLAHQFELSQFGAWRIVTR